MVVTNYLWDTESDNILMETDENDITTVVYTTEPNGDLNSQLRDVNSSYYHSDGQGSVTELTDESENVTDTYKYSAFGEEISHTGTTLNPFRYLGIYGYYYDEETGEYYVRARILYPKNGRWASTDPIGLVDGLNLYLYVLNNPINYYDPSGLVVRDFNPKKPDSMDWCSVGTFYPGSERAGKERAEGNGTTYDPNGFKEGKYGETVPVYYDIKCVCDCCNKQKDLYQLKCTVRAYLRVKLSPSNIKVSTNSKVTLRGSYGHEQRHVKNLLEVAEGVAQAAEAYEKVLGCKNTLLNCNTSNFAFTFGMNAILRSTITQEEDHDHPSGHPIEGKSYEPIGTMPRNSDCKAPGVPKDIKPGKKCC